MQPYRVLGHDESYHPNTELLTDLVHESNVTMDCIFAIVESQLSCSTDAIVM